VQSDFRENVEVGMYAWTTMMASFTAREENTTSLMSMFSLIAAVLT
jgi:hypothetical protein